MPIHRITLGDGSGKDQREIHIEYDTSTRQLTVVGAEMVVARFPFTPTGRAEGIDFDRPGDTHAMAVRSFRVGSNALVTSMDREGGPWSRIAPRITVNGEGGAIRLSMFDWREREVFSNNAPLQDTVPQVAGARQDPD
jgi:hypothetical protein